MVRTQIQLTEEQARQVRRAARLRGVSMAEVIRGFVTEGVAAAPTERRQAFERAQQLIGRFPDRERRRDLAAQHDRYLADAFD